MSLLLPETGLLFWMLLAFGVLFFVLYKYAFPVILSSIDERKKFIDDALENAKEANERLARIEQQGDVLIKTAQEEPARILREAVTTRDQIIKEARAKAEMEGEKIMAETRRLVQLEKEEAMRDMRAQVAELSIMIAEKVLHKELSDDASQQAYTRELLDKAFNTEENNKE